MAEGSLAVLALVSLTILGALLADLAFRRLRIPDILFLLLVGGLLGPLLGIIEPAIFAPALPALAALAVTVVVFDGAILLTKQGTREGLTAGVVLALFVFAGTVVLAGLGLHLGLGLPPVAAILGGAMVGGAGVVIVLPLIRALKPSGDAVSLVTVETVVSDLLVVIVVYSVASWAAAGTQSNDAALGFLLGVAIAALLGGSTGYLWRHLVARNRETEYEYLATLAVLLGVYALATTWGGAGIVAVFAFGLVVGRSPLGARLTERTTYSTQIVGAPRDRYVTIFRSGRGVHHDVVFLVRAFFFIGLGIILDWGAFLRPEVLAAGLLAAAAVASARLAVTYWRLRGVRSSPYDRLSIGLMFPLGLAAAVTSVVPYQLFAVPGTEILPAVVAVAIVATNALSALGVLILLRSDLRPAQVTDEVASQPS